MIELDTEELPESLKMQMGLLDEELALYKKMREVPDAKEDLLKTILKWVKRAG